MTNHTDPPDADCGVLVGRFQVAALTDGHRNLVEGVIANHSKVVVVLGVSPLVVSHRDPLDFEARKQMLVASYPNLIVLPLKDVNNDLLWSQRLDEALSTVVSPTQSVLLYGGRDSFIHSYLGRHDTRELPARESASGSDVRAALAREARDSEHWRAGVIWASRNRFPVSYTCVDVAIFNEDYTQMLLGHKPGEPAWRLVGGFTDPFSSSIEHDATREVREETGLEVLIQRLSYLGSYAIDDWRYRGEPDSIKSALFAVSVSGPQSPKAADDIDKVEWFDLTALDPTATPVVMELHRPLVTRAILHARHLRSNP